MPDHQAATPGRATRYPSFHLHLSLRLQGMPTAGLAATRWLCSGIKIDMAMLDRKSAAMFYRTSAVEYLSGGLVAIDLVRLAKSASSDAEAAKALRAATKSPIEAIKAFREGRSVSLGDAKRAIMTSPSWAAEAVAHEAFLDQLERELDRGAP